MTEPNREPGWLMEQAKEAGVRVKANHSRWYVQHYFPALDVFPVGWDDAEAILAVMSKRFESWTGRSIEDHIRARPEK